MADTLTMPPPMASLFPDRPASPSSHTGSQQSSFVSRRPSNKKASPSTSPGHSPGKDYGQSPGQHLPDYNTGDPRPRKRLRSQYPLYSAEPHVQYIFVASFDIDRGPIVEHQYPAVINPDEAMLAELMLPDQTHMRSQDWTMFFLHKDSSPTEEEAAEREYRRQIREERRLARAEAVAAGEVVEDIDEDTESEDSESDDPEAPALMYVLNLVNTKQDSTAKRGAVVKAMAICTRHPFLHIYKPLLLLALEDYFKSPELATLEQLYRSVNSMDLSLMPRLTPVERQILQDSDAKDMFVEKFEQLIVQRQNDEAAGKIEYLESPPRAGVRYSVPRDTHEFESKIVYNGIPVPVKIPTALVPETVGDFSLIKLIQIFGNPHASQPQPFAIHPHLTTSGAFTHPIIVLLNAVITQKRIIFMGHGRPSGEVAEAVLAACAIASGGVLRGFTRHAFPYTDLSKADDLQKVQGFIAGVTNPAFSWNPAWWDLLCDLPSGRIKISSAIEPAAVTEGSTYFQQHGYGTMKDTTHSDATGDVAFMEDINRSIASRHGESIIRAKFRSYVTKFTRVAAAFEETVYGASALSVISPTEMDNPEVAAAKAAKSSTKRPVSLRASSKNLKGHGYVWPSDEAKMRELAASAARIEGWRSTRSYYLFIQDLAAHSLHSLPPNSSLHLSDLLSLRLLKPQMDLYHSLSKLRTLRLLPSEAAVIYLAIDAYCTDHDSILELLELTPMWEAGLFHISLGLWHEDFRVREAVVALLDRIRNHPAGRIFFARLGGWTNAGFKRCLAERESRQQTLKEDLSNLMAPMTLSDSSSRS